MPKCHATNRQGKQCSRDAIKGAAVCHMHGGSAPQVREAAKQRLLALVDPALAVIRRQIVSKNRELVSEETAQKAAFGALDRAGFKPTDKLEISGPGGGPILSADLSRCTVEELEMLLRLSERMKAPAAIETTAENIPESEAGSGAA